MSNHRDTMTVGIPSLENVSLPTYKSSIAPFLLPLTAEIFPSMTQDESVLFAGTSAKQSNACYEVGPATWMLF